MRLTRLTINGVRNLHGVEIEPGPRLNLFIGPNGAGKTSILEALYALSSGRSFRGGRTPLLARTAQSASVFAELKRGKNIHRVGFERSASGWRARADGTAVTSLADLAQQLAVLVFHPGLHALVEGAPGVRRRFLDFGVFHVEHDFLHSWRAYAKALKQRNAALKQSAPVEGWERAMVVAAEPLNQARQRYVDQLYPAFRQILGQLTLELGELEFTLKRGWGDEDLGRLLDSQRNQDRASGWTRSGPHRADLAFHDADGNVSGRLSRGQQKLVALALVLAQATVLRAHLGEAPVVALDDLASELDADRRQLALAVLEELDCQIWVTGTDPLAQSGRMFHVEHGAVNSASCST